MKKLCLVLMCLTILASATWGVANEEKGHVCFRKIDTDRNGEVTFEEFEAVFGPDKEKFDKVDENKDGRLTHNEYHKSLGHGASGDKE